MSSVIWYNCTSCKINACDIDLSYVLLRSCEVMIKRDRNHPSIVVWSICNERLCETADVWGDAKRLKALAERLDPFMGRVVSANYNEFNSKNTPMDGSSCPS